MDTRIPGGGVFPRNKPRQPATAAEPLEDALAYAFARAALPDRFETSRQYAERIVPLMRESGYIEAEAADQSGIRAALIDAIIKVDADLFKEGHGESISLWRGGVKATAYTVDLICAAIAAVERSAASAEPTGEPEERGAHPLSRRITQSEGKQARGKYARPPVAGPDAGLREAAGLLADAVRRYFDEHEAKAVVNMQPLVERIEALVAGPDAGERWDKNEGPPFSGDRAPADPEAGDE